jgi:hypothetical protein
MQQRHAQGRGGGRRDGDVTFKALDRHRWRRGWVIELSVNMQIASVRYMYTKVWVG